MSHSLEPWCLSREDRINGVARMTDAEGLLVQAFDNNLERIVACVNACRHLPTEFLGQLANGLDAVALVQAQQYAPRRKLNISGG